MAHVLTDVNMKELKELQIGQIGILKKSVGFSATQNSRTLVIGLGGMGLKTLLNLKRELNDRVGKIDGNYIQFLSIDTDKVDREKALNSGILNEWEIPAIDNSNVAQALKAPVAHRPATITNIIPVGFTQALTGEGANQVRLAGRLTIMDTTPFRSIYDAIEGSIRKLQNFATATLDVQIVAGIGGGSGSGLVIDIPYIVRAITQKLGIASAKVRIFGNVYLPNSYYGISNLKAAKRNGYAALQEIDYLMKLESNNETFDVTYPEPVGAFSSQENIFVQCTLIGGKIAENIVINNPQEKAISVCVENLINQCTSVAGNITDGAGNTTVGSITDFFTSQSFYTNADTALSTVMQGGNVKFPGYGNYSYNLIGASSIKFPTDAITEQLIGEISKKMDERFLMNADRITQADVDAFEKGLIKPEEIIARFSRSLDAKIDEINSDPNTNWTKPSILTSEHDIPLNNLITKCKQSFAEDQTPINQAIADANDRAAKIFADVKKGPYFLSKLLLSESSAGGRVVGLYEKFRGYRSTVSELKKTYEKTREEARAQKSALADTMQKFGHFNSNLNKFKEILKTIYLSEFKIVLCDILNDSYYVDINTGMGKMYQLKNSLDKNFLYFIDIYAAISKIMINNLPQANKKLNEDSENDPASIFSLQDSIFIPLKTTVMNTARRKMEQMGDTGVDNYAAAFTNAIINNRDDWKMTENCQYGESKCAESFRKFIANYEPISDIVNRKMLDYFNEAYEAKSDSEKIQVVKIMLNDIQYKAAPMCNVWNSPYFNFADVKPLCYQYMVLPSLLMSDDSWGSKFKNQFGSGLTKNIYESPDQNTIYSYTLYAKMPIWVHQDLTEYELEYNADKSAAGVHIDENNETVPALREYPALMHPSQYWRTTNGSLVYKNEDELKKFENLGLMFRLAKEYGIISKNTMGEYVVNVITDKPNPADDRSNIRIKSFVDEYMNTEAFKDERGRVKIKKECCLFNEVMKKFGYEEHKIYGGHNCKASDDETSIALLRKQMKLCKILADELQYFKDNFENPVKKGNGILDRDLRLKNLAKYMLFDIVFVERGAYKYRLGDQVFTITTKFDVEDNEMTSWMSEYMELAVAGILEDLLATKEAHKDAINDRVKTIQRGISAGDDEAYAKLNAKYEELKSIFEANVSAIDKKKLDGNILSARDQEIRSGYASLLDSVKSLMKTFA